jgi:hypothetical protein
LPPECWVMSAVSFIPVALKKIRRENGWAVWETFPIAAVELDRTWAFDWKKLYLRSSCSAPPDAASNWHQKCTERLLRQFVFQFQRNLGWKTVRIVQMLWALPSWPAVAAFQYISYAYMCCHKFHENLHIHFFLTYSPSTPIKQK